jgi:large subunit ribosomal protein L29
MELAKIRALSDEELTHHEKTSAEQLFRLRFQVSMGQNDGVKKLRALRKEIAQVKTVSRERELGIRGAEKDAPAVAPAKAVKVAKTVKVAKPAKEPKAVKEPKAAKEAKAVKAEKTVKKGAAK